MSKVEWRRRCWGKFRAFVGCYDLVISGFGYVCSGRWSTDEVGLRCPMYNNLGSDRGLNVQLLRLQYQMLSNTILPHQTRILHVLDTMSSVSRQPLPTLNSSPSPQPRSPSHAPPSCDPTTCDKTATPDSPRTPAPTPTPRCPSDSAPAYCSTRSACRHPS